MASNLDEEILKNDNLTNNDTEAGSENIHEAHDVSCVVTSDQQIVSLMLPSQEVNLGDLTDMRDNSEQQASQSTVDSVFMQKDDSVLHEDPGQLIQQDHEQQQNKQQVVCKVTDGQPVQFEDGSVAYLHTTAREGSQPIQLEDGTTAYICRTAPEPEYLPQQPHTQEENLANKPPTNMDLNKEPINEDGSSVVKFTMSNDRIVQIGEKAFRCSYEGCGRLYTTQHHLRVHERSHTGDRPFRCDFAGCGKGFATGYGLKSHTRVHTGEKPYKCLDSLCGKAFKTSGDLQKHIRIHTGERPFKCPFEGCERSFTTSNIRKVHIRTHTGEKPYVCTQAGCNRTFASATNYKNHIRIHTGEKPYVCTVEGCNKRFTEYSSLYKHHVVHTHQKPYICSHCGKTYRQTSTLAMHKRTSHNDDSGVDMEAAYAQHPDVTSPPNKRQHVEGEGALVINTSEAQQVAMVAGMTSDQAIAAIHRGSLQSGQIVTVSTGEHGEQIYVVTDPSHLAQLGLQVDQQPIAHHHDQVASDDTPQQLSIVQPGDDNPQQLSIVQSGETGDDNPQQLSIVQPGDAGEDIMQPLVQQ